MRGTPETFDGRVRETNNGDTIHRERFHTAVCYVSDFCDGNAGLPDNPQLVRSAPRRCEAFLLDDG